MATSVMLFENDGILYDDAGNVYTMQSGTATPTGQVLTDAEFSSLQNTGVLPQGDSGPGQAAVLAAQAAAATPAASSSGMSKGAMLALGAAAGLLLYSSNR